MTQGTIRVFAGSVMLALVASAMTHLSAQAPAASGDTVRCDAVLTSAEATAVAGDTYEGPVVTEPRPGFTSCDWQGNDSNFGFTFASLAALKADDRKAEEEFEFDVVAVEEGNSKREVLEGIGVRAALVVLQGDASLIVVQRKDGVARMVLYKVPRETALGLARAIAAP